MCDLTGPFVAVGGSVGPVGLEYQFGHSCSGKHIVVRNVSVGRSWGPAEAHADITPTGVLAPGGTDPCVPMEPYPVRHIWLAGGEAAGGVLIKMVAPSTSGARRWRRPYRLGFACYAFIAFLLFIEYQAALIVAAVARGDGVPVAAQVAMAAGVLVVPLAVCVRGARVGLYVGDAGIRYAGMLRTVTIPWRDVESVELQDKPMPRQVAIRRTDGLTIPLGLLFRGSAFLVGGPSTATIRDAVKAELERRR